MSKFFGCMQVVVMACGLMMLLTPALSGAITPEELDKIEWAMPTWAPAQPERPRTLLVINRAEGFVHKSIPYWDKALEIMGKKTGAFSVSVQGDLSALSDTGLNAFDAICFNNTTHLKPNEKQRAALMRFIRGGKGIVGIHAGCDNFNEWPEGMHLMGNRFSGHPWGAGGTWSVKVDDPTHALTRPFVHRTFTIKDEIYRVTLPYYGRDKMRVLLSLDMSDPATKGAKGVRPSDADTGISWVKRVGQGRLFYSCLGHNTHITWNKPVLEHYLAGIQFALGDLSVETEPSVPAESERP